MDFLAVIVFKKCEGGGINYTLSEFSVQSFKNFQIFKKDRENFQQILPKGGRGGQRPFRKLPKKSSILVWDYVPKQVQHLANLLWKEQSNNISIRAHFA